MGEKEDNEGSFAVNAAVLAIFVALAPAFWISSYYLNAGTDLLLYCITGVFGAILYLKIKRNSSRRILWAIGVLYALHVAVILLIPIPDYVPGPILIISSLVDLVVVEIILGRIDDSTTS